MGGPAGCSSRGQQSSLQQGIMGILLATEVKAVWSLCVEFAGSFLWVLALQVLQLLLAHFKNMHVR